jgi:hypothetical protein
VDVFRCDYCGLFKSWKRARVAYVFDYEARHDHDMHRCDDSCHDVTDDVFTASITCSEHCAEQSIGRNRVGGG